MKTTQSLILITFVTIAFIPKSFAQDASPEYVVRQIYFHPSDRQSSKHFDTALDELVADVQQLYADEMERHGFGRKTFKLERDASGNTVRHNVKGKLPSTDYQNHIYVEAQREIREHFDMSENFINLIFIDVDDLGGGGYGGPFRGTAHIRYSNIDKVLKSTVRFRVFDIVAHELGHAFGLLHDFRDDRYILSYGPGGGKNQLSYCAAEWLNVHRYFNTTQSTFDEVPAINMLEPTFASPPNTIRLQFEITHSAELHQAQLFVKDYFYPPRVNPVLFDCKSLNGNNTKIQFYITVSPIDENVTLHVVDVHGNFTRKLFPIDAISLLPASQPVSIPDANLAAAIRNSLGLVAESPITTHDMLELEKLKGPAQHKDITPDKQIKDLTGLENAVNLRVISLSNNQIVNLTPLTRLTKIEHIFIAGNQIIDINPLAKLTNLNELSLASNQIIDINPLAELKNLTYLNLTHNQITDEALTLLTEFQELIILDLGRNQIRDITPLAGLTKLEQLTLGGNQIIDIRPLAGLTRLTYLDLNANHITDVSPLVQLVNLEQVHLQANPIINRKPLRELLRTNPDVMIYLKYGRDPLPVSLSHFKAEHTDAGVILKWTTESEVDNAGFYIYRSQIKDGDFKVVNPNMIQGAGTTGERNEYTWTDTTAKPNTVYFYRIEDISHAGEREQLVTVRLRGLISAHGKLTTPWADIKNHR